MDNATVQERQIALIGFIIFFKAIGANGFLHFEMKLLPAITAQFILPKECCMVIWREYFAKAAYPAGI